MTKMNWNQKKLMVSGIVTTSENLCSAFMDHCHSISGIRFFRLRLLELLEFMVILEPIHFAAAFLHPRYRYLRGCSQAQVSSCKSYVRQRINEIRQQERVSLYLRARQSAPLVSLENTVADPRPKKRRRFGQEFESGDLSDEYTETEDEVDTYLSMRIDPELIVDNPLVFWRAQQTALPVLSKLARMIHCVPATTASVERQFSGGGQIVNERRSSISPKHVNDILFLRSVTR